MDSSGGNIKVPEPQQLKASFLCYGLSSSSVTTLNALAEEAGAGVALTAYPLIAANFAGLRLGFGYRSTSFKGRFVRVNRIKGDAPEGTLLSASVRTAWAAARDGDILCHLGVQGIPAVMATIFAKLLRKPMVTVTQTTLPAAERKRLFAIRALKGWILRNSVVVWQTPPTLETLQQIYRLPAETLIEAPWDGGSEAFAPLLAKYRSEPRENLRDQFRIPHNAYVIAYTGTLIGYKGLDVLLKAVKLLSRSEVLVILTGPEGKPSGTTETLRKLAVDEGLADSVRFLGPIEWESLAQVYLLSDVFVLPTRRDVWPKVLIEAAMAGLPLITTNVCGAAGYVVRDGINGAVVPVNDAVALAEALRHLADRDVRRRMGEASETFAREYTHASKNLEARGLMTAIRRAAANRH